MRTIQLLIAPLLCLGFLASCNKDRQISAEELKKEISKTYNIDFIKEKYTGKKVTLKIKMDDQEFTKDTKVKSIEEVTPGLPVMYFEETFSVAPTILSTGTIDSLTEMYKDNGKFYLSNGSYKFVYSETDVFGIKLSGSCIWNKDFVTTHSDNIDKTDIETHEYILDANY